MRLYILCGLLAGPVFAQDNGQWQDPAQSPSQAANGITWITPTASQGLIPGGQIAAQWRSDTPLDAPAFALCTETSCGDPTYPQIVHNDDGSSTARLSLPDMPAMYGMHLRMTPGGNYADSTSPSFNVDLAQDASTNNPYYVSTSSTSESSTKWHKTNTPSATTTALFTAPSLPPLPTLTPSLSITSAISPSTTPIQLAENLNTRPTAIAIAVPLSICALIALIALIFCARSKVFRGPSKDPEKDWEAALKAKIEESKVTVTQRDLSDLPAARVPSGNPAPAYDDIDRRGSFTRRESGDQYSRRPSQREPYDRREFDTGKNYAEDYRTPRRENYEYRRGETSRRGSNDCSYDKFNPRDHRDPFDLRDRYMPERSRSRDGFDRSYDLRTESSRSSRCLTPIREGERFTRLPSSDRDYEDRRRERERYYSTSRRSTSSLGGYDDHPPKRPSYDRMASVESTQSRRSIVNPHPASLSPGTRSPPYRPPVEEYRASRPLPAVRDGQWPHRTGVLEREYSSSSTHYLPREKPRDEMEDLYESLRMAIGSPAPR